VDPEPTTIRAALLVDESRDSDSVDDHIERIFVFANVHAYSASGWLSSADRF